MAETLMCVPKLLAQDLNDRTYIVTGANSGTGLSTTTQLVRQGANANDDAIAERLDEVSRKLVGLAGA